MSSTQQRDVLLGDQTRIVSDADDLLARFESLRAPTLLQPLHADTGDARQRNEHRLSDYVQRLDAARNRAELIRAARSLVTLRDELRDDGRAIKAGLLHLGADQCELRPPPRLHPVSLPRLHAKPAKPSSGGVPSAGTPTPQSQYPERSAPDSRPPPPAATGGVDGAGTNDGPAAATGGNAAGGGPEADRLRPNVAPPTTVNSGGIG